MIQFNLSSPDDENCQFSDYGDSSDEENENSNLAQDFGTPYSEQSETDEDGNLILKAFLGRWASECNILGNAINLLLKGLKSLKNQNDTFAKFQWSSVLFSKHLVPWTTFNILTGFTSILGLPKEFCVSLPMYHLVIFLTTSKSSST